MFELVLDSVLIVWKLNLKAIKIYPEFISN